MGTAERTSHNAGPDILRSGAIAAVVPYAEQSTTSIIGWSDDIRIAWDPDEPATPPERWQVLSE